MLASNVEFLQQFREIIEIHLNYIEIGEISLWDFVHMDRKFNSPLVRVNFFFRNEAKRRKIARSRREPNVINSASVLRINTRILDTYYWHTCICILQAIMYHPQATWIYNRCIYVICWQSRLKALHISINVQAIIGSIKIFFSIY